MYKKVLLVSFFLGFPVFTVNASNFGIGVFGQFDSLDRYHGSSSEMGLGANFSYEIEAVTLHAIVYESATMDALWQSSDELGYSDIVIEADYSSVGVAISKYYSITEHFNIYGIIGVLRTEYDKNINIGGVKNKVNDSETPVFVGLGLSYLLGRNWKASAEINTGYSDIVETGSFQAGISYHF